MSDVKSRDSDRRKYLSDSIISTAFVIKLTAISLLIGAGVTFVASLAIPDKIYTPNFMWLTFIITSMGSWLHGYIGARNEITRSLKQWNNWTEQAPTQPEPKKRIR